MNVSPLDETCRRTEEVHQPTEIPAILFDLDGTLIDTYELILTSMDYTMKTVLGKEFSAACLMKKVGQPLATQMRDYAQSEEQVTELLQVYREHNKVYHDKLAHAFDGVSETLCVLQERGYRLGVVTSKRHGPALNGLRLFDLEKHFEFIIGADDCEKHKPDPAPIIAGAQKMNLSPDVCAYIGDSPYDIQAGKAAGAYTVAALWGMFSIEELQAENPDNCCHQFSELAQVFA